jgi:hypothetical protein
MLLQAADDDFVPHWVVNVDDDFFRLLMAVSSSS